MHSAPCIAARRLCSASTTDQLHVIGDSDSGRLIGTGRRVGKHVVSSFETDFGMTPNQSPSTAAFSTTTRRRRQRLPTTRAPTTAPTTPTLPDQSALNSTCNVHVSSTSGSDFDTCGSNSSSACGTIQQGIDRAGAFNTVCVHAGGLSKPNCAVV